MYDVKSGECMMPTRGGRVATYPVTIEAGESGWRFPDMALTRERARESVERGFATAQALGFKVAIAVVDDAGHWSSAIAWTAPSG